MRSLQANDVTLLQMAANVIVDEPTADSRPLPSTFEIVKSQPSES